MIRVLVLLVLLCFGCQTGRIPCPKFKSAKSGHHKRYRSYSASLTAKADVKSEEIKSKKPTDAKYIQHVSVDEWDCPQPGSKKYLPKNVKANIRRNAKRINEDAQKISADSVFVE
jgi:hypothetical protein